MTGLVRIPVWARHDPGDGWIADPARSSVPRSLRSGLTDTFRSSSDQRCFELWTMT